MANENEEVKYALKQGWLDRSYIDRPYHWRKNRLEAYRYDRLTDIIVNSLISRLADDAVICDYGCGDGRTAYLVRRELVRYGKTCSVVGVDVSEPAIRWAQTMTAQEPGLSFVAGGPERIPPNTMALILREVIEHLPEPDIDKVLDRARELGATVVLTTPSLNSPLGRAHLRHYDSEQLLNTLRRNGFEVLRIDGFGWRPARLYRPLLKLKSTLSLIPLAWRIMNPCWRIVSPASAITLVAVAEPRRPHV